ncbi:MAG: hypothetical protein C4567_12425 [Deltaproteobacteria bacterium]|nr:MAG: hypothetical protein C4567_12425 [Deltaproteobacteria bacterium]
MPNGRFVWTPRGGTEQSYTFPVNYSWGFEHQHQDFGDRARAIDGTLRSYRRDYKQRWSLRFNYISEAQKEKFKEIKDAQVDLDFYDLSGEKVGTFDWTNNFNFVAVPGSWWSGTIELEEV